MLPLGLWVKANDLVSEKMERTTEIESQAPAWDAQLC